MSKNRKKPVKAQTRPAQAAGKAKAPQKGNAKKAASSNPGPTAKKAGNTPVAPAKPNVFARYWMLGLVLLVGIVAYSMAFDAKVDLSGDNVSYYKLGKAVAGGKGFVNINNPQLNASNHFPPGYPAIMAVFMVFADSITFMKVLNGLFFLGSLVLMWLIFWHFSKSRALAAVVCILLALNAHLLRYSTIMMSEIPYLFCSMLALWFLLKNQEAKKPWLDVWFWACLVAIVLTYHIRSLGISLVGAIFIYWLFKKQWLRAGVWIGGFVLLALPWFLRGQALGGSSYVRQLKMINPYRAELGQAGFGDIVDRFIENVSRYFSIEIKEAMFPAYNVDYSAGASVAGWFWSLLIIAIGLYGLFSLGKYRWLVLFYILGTFGVLFLWPQVWIGIRFLLPAMPVLMFIFVFGLYKGLSFVAQRFNAQRSVSPWLLAPLAFLLFAGVGKVQEQANRKNPANWANYFEVAKWVEKNLPPDTYLACRKPDLFYLYANCYTTRYLFRENDQEILQDFQDRNISYVVVDQLGFSSTPRYLVPAIQKNQQFFEVVKVFKNPDTYLLRFKGVPANN